MQNLVLDVETTKFPNAYPWVAGSYLVSIHAHDGVDSLSWLYNHPESDQTQAKIFQEVQAWINVSDRIIGHGFKFDMHWLKEIGLDFQDKMVYDTLIAEYVLRNFQRLDGMKLDQLCNHYGIPGKLDKVKLYWDSDYETDEIPANILCEYGEQDCRSTLGVFHKQVPLIKERGIERLIAVEMESIKYLHEAEYNGMRVDVELLKDYADKLEEKVAELDSKMRGLIGNDEINLSSNQHLSAILYGGYYKVDGVEETERVLKDGTVKRGTRKCKVEKYTKGFGIKPLPNTETKNNGVYKVDEPTLFQLRGNTPEAKEFLITFKERAKLETQLKTFFRGLSEKEMDGYVHPTLHQDITKTSRLSSSKPNGQNFPRGSTGDVKKCFITRY